MKTTLTSKGQVTVPKDVRERLGWDRGLVLEVRTSPSGTVELVPLNRDPLEELFGSLAHLVEARKKKGPFDDRQVKEALRARAAERFQRIGESSDSE